MIESIVLPSLGSDLIMITELLMEESSPGTWYCDVTVTISIRRHIRHNIPPVSSDGSKDRYEEVWIEGWI